MSDLVSAHVHSLDGRSAASAARGRRVLRRWRRDRALLSERPRWDPEQVDAFQLERVRAVVEHAFATHPFYHRIYREAGYRSGDLVDWSDYDALPTVSKQDIVDHYDEFTAHRALAVDDVFSSRTSGSSGTVLRILQDEATSDAGHVFYLRHYEQMLGRERRPDELVYEIYLVAQRYPSLDGAYPAFTLSQNCPTGLALEHLRQTRPPLLWAFPSYLLRMAREAGDLRDLGVEAVCTHSEGSTAQERALLAEAFGAPVLDEYASEELYLIATECREGHYHLVQDNVRVDVVDAGPDGRGAIVGTSLINSYMPFIRYRQGDLIALDDTWAPCACGNRFRVLDQLLGRADQCLVRTDGTVAAPDRVMGIYDDTLLTAGARVAEFRILQAADRSVVVLLRRTGRDAHADALLEDFRGRLRQLLGGPEAALEVREVERMPELASHKRRLVISEAVATPAPAPAVMPV